jgi:hypothetical protein
LVESTTKGTGRAGIPYLQGQQGETAMARKYSKAAGKKVEKALHEMHEGTLKSGRSKKTVKSRKQAIAIGLSEARAEGKKVPRQAKKTPRKSKKKR